MINSTVDTMGLDQLREALPSRSYSIWGVENSGKPVIFKLAVLALWVMISYGMLKILESNSLWVIKNSGMPVISILRSIFGGKILFLS